LQVNATLIAAQQAAREAQDRFQAAHFAARQPAATGFAAALEKEGFAPLPLKQSAAPTPATDGAPLPRPGSLLDIRI
jgi:hypothetical protein